MPAEKMHLGETITQANEPLLPQEGSNRRESSLGPSKGTGHEDREPGKLRATRGGSGSLGWAQDPLREGQRVGTMSDDRESPEPRPPPVFAPCRLCLCPFKAGRAASLILGEGVGSGRLRRQGSGPGPGQWEGGRSRMPAGPEQRSPGLRVIPGFH